MKNLTEGITRFMAYTETMRAVFTKPDPHYTYNCENRSSLHKIAETHPHIRSVNQQLDKRRVPLEKHLIEDFRRGMEIDLYPADSFIDRRIQEFKSIKNETKIAMAFRQASKQSPAKSHKQIYNQVGYYSHLLFGAMQAALTSRINVIEDMHSCGLSSGTGIDYHIYSSKK